MVKRALLICALGALASTAFAAPSLPRDFSPVFVKAFRHRAAQARPVAGLSKSAAMDWKKTASIEYHNTDYTGSGVTWGFSSRDTVEYDLGGYMVVTKKSYAVSGWSPDSLGSLDSCVYVNGNMVEEIQEDFSLGSIAYGYRDTYTQSPDGKSMVNIHANWDSTKKAWAPSNKDSFVLSVPFTNFTTGFTIGDFSSLVREVVWNFDTVKANWKLSGDLARVDSECNATTVVLAGKESLFGTDSLSVCKIIMTFISTVKTGLTVTGETVQIPDSVTGAYKDYGRVLLTYDQSGFQTSVQFAGFDSLTQRMEDLYKSLFFPDASGNDTLEVYCDYTASTGIWDTSGETRDARLYDARGNNVSIITSYFEPSDGTWNVQTKDTVFFAQVNTKVLHEPSPGVSRNIVIRKTPASIRFSAPGISGLGLYDLSGRLVASVSQKPGSSLELAFGSHNAIIRTGTYVARLVVGEGEMSFKVPVTR